MIGGIILTLGVWGMNPAGSPAPVPDNLILERVTTKVPFPRGLAMVEGKLFVLCRGRVRGAGAGGGVSAAVEDQAGTIYEINPEITEPVGISTGTVSGSLVSGGGGGAVQGIGVVVAHPTAPPFLLWDRSSSPPQRDRETDRPYCTLRWHEPTRSFYVCAFSGIDKQQTASDPVAFSKNRTDAILRYDLRTEKWHEVERHDLEAGGTYPHTDPEHTPPPHGWLNGPDNCLPLGRWLYAVAKENSVLVRYDLSPLVDDPENGPPRGEFVLGDRVRLTDGKIMNFRGHSALAYREGWLYIGARTTSQIIRIALDDDFNPIQPLRAELVARFEPWDARTRRSADITDMCFDDTGRLYVVSAQPARVYRFQPDPREVFAAHSEGEQPWADLASMTGNPQMKSENILWHEGWIYVTSGDGYDYQEGASGTVYRVRVDDR